MISADLTASEEVESNHLLCCRRKVLVPCGSVIGEKVAPVALRQGFQKAVDQDAEFGWSLKPRRSDIFVHKQKSAGLRSRTLSEQFFQF